MKANGKRSRVARTTTCRKEYKLVTNDKIKEQYWDECITFYPMLRTRGAKSTNKRIMSYQVRMYKTWKHNRKTQWKI